MPHDPRYRYFLGQVEPLGDDEVAGLALTGGVKRDGQDWDPAGIDLTAYRSNPIVLRQHNVEQPVGIATAIGLVSGGIGIRIQFAPLGASAVADETRALVKSGVLGALSAGINPLEQEPIDGRNPRNGVRVTRAELLEVSLVAVPADPDARILQRSYQPRVRSLIRDIPAVGVAARERAAGAFRSVQVPRQPVYDGDMAQWAADMRAHLERRTLDAGLYRR
jgi:HK97 family phage prohead protease